MGPETQLRPFFRGHFAQKLIVYHRPIGTIDCEISSPVDGRNLLQFRVSKCEVPGELSPKTAKISIRRGVRKQKICDEILKSRFTYPPCQSWKAVS
jgi:hypothetical protein